MSIASSTPTTTSSVDVSDFEQMLESEDLSIPCESTPHWHTTGSEPAAWVLWIKPPCCSPRMRFNCDSCVQKKLADRSPVIWCNICKTIYPGPVSVAIVRMERIK